MQKESQIMAEIIIRIFNIKGVVVNVSGFPTDHSHFLPNPRVNHVLAPTVIMPRKAVHLSDPSNEGDQRIKERTDH